MTFPDEFRTLRLKLRCPRLNDAEAVVRLVNTPDIARMVSSMPYPYTRDDAVKWISGKWRADSQGEAYELIIERLEDGAVVGATGAICTGEGVYEIGYWIGVPYWGMGYATEAAQGVIDILRGHMQAGRVEAGYFTDNPASKRVQEKLGMRYTGETREYFSKGRGEKIMARRMVLEL